MKNKQKRNGFTLIEILATIIIITFVLSIAGTVVFSVVNHSKSESEKIALENIKKSAGFYITEYADEVAWLGESNKYTCVSVNSLIGKGYFKEDDVLDYNNKYLKVVKDKDNNILYEKISDPRECDKKITIVDVPNSKEVCNDLTYSNREQSLINPDALAQGINFVLSESKGTNAGSYTVRLNLSDYYYWNDGTREEKKVTCTIKKATPHLEIDPNQIDAPTLGTTINIKLKSNNINGNVYVKSSDSKYVTIGNIDDKKVTTEEEKDIPINILATRKTITYVTVTVIPREDDAKNYYSGSIVLPVGEISKKKAIIPNGNSSETDDSGTNNYCINPIYNDTSQEITYAPGSKDNKEISEAGYSFVNNIQKDIGTYEVLAKLNPGYVWEDGNTEDKILSCNILNPNIKVEYREKDGSSVKECDPNNKTVKYDDKYGNDLCQPTRDGYTFLGWYFENTYKTKVNSDTIVNKYYNHNIYARWRKNLIYVKYNINKDYGSAFSTNNTNYKLDENTGNVLIKKNGTFTDIIDTFNYGETEINLHNYNSSDYINVSNPNLSVPTKMEWRNKNADGASVFNQASKTVNANDLCDATKDDCTVTLYVNWNVNLNLIELKGTSDANSTINQLSDNLNIYQNTITIKKPYYGSDVSFDLGTPTDYNDSCEKDNVTPNNKWKTLGWTKDTSATADVQYENGGVASLSENTNLYARYMFTATFYYDYNSSEAQSYVPSRHEDININSSGDRDNLGPWTEIIRLNQYGYSYIPKKTGWIFDSWCEDNDGKDSNGDRSFECDNRLLKRVSWDVDPSVTKTLTFTCKGRFIFAEYHK